MGLKRRLRLRKDRSKGVSVRFGHGLQRSFLLVILQELAALEQQADSSDKPTLVWASKNQSFISIRLKLVIFLLNFARWPTPEARYY